MNKEEVLKLLEEKTGLSYDICVKIDEIVESHFIIGKNNKEKIIADLKEQLGFGDEEADDIYNKMSEIIAGGIKDKLKHPFKSLD